MIFRNATPLRCVAHYKLLFEWSLNRLQEFFAESGEAFVVGARIPTETGAEEGVFFVAFQAKARGLFVEATKFFGVFHPLHESFG